MTSFSVMALSECCEIISGATPSTSVEEYWDGEICWATPKDLSDLKNHYISNTPRKLSQQGLRSCAASVLPTNSVLFSSRAPIGHVAINTVPMATNQGFKSFIPQADLLDAKFLFHWLKANRPYLENLGVGATFKEVSKAIVAKIQVPVPPLVEQRRIAAILDQADALRAKRREALAQLDSLAQSIFIEMFGNQLPTTGAGTPLSKLVEINPKITPSERECLAEKMVTFLPMASISDKEKRVLTVEKRPYREVSKGYTPFKVGDVLLAKITPCYENGKLAIVEGVPTEFGFGSTEFHVFRPDTAELGLFVFHLLQLDWIAAAGAKAMKGAAGQKRVPADFFGNLTIRPPQASQLAIFANRISVINNLKANCRNALEELDALFSSLKNRAFRGEL